jgi:hypothetical protein
MWTAADVAQNRLLLRSLFNVLHFCSWRIKNTALIMRAQADLFHLLVCALFHPAYRGLDMARVVYGIMNTCSLAEDKSAVYALLPHLPSLFAHVRFDPVARRDVVVQLRFSRVIGHVAFFDEQVRVLRVFGIDVITLLAFQMSSPSFALSFDCSHFLCHSHNSASVHPSLTGCSIGIATREPSLKNSACGRNERRSA